ncbi:hypothetical protein BASA81_015340 [Batrachochytrium salamandrivorans]|nr:hypothetical protein BASA81_015340 [Batrachochytrium salamandrivorans]
MEDDEQSSSDLDIATRLRDSEVDIRQRFQLGEYKIVMQLIAVLQYGKFAKLLTDKAIDMSDQCKTCGLPFTSTVCAFWLPRLAA